MHPFCAAVDWGTSSFRAWLLGEHGEVVAGTRSSEGMATLRREEFAPVLEKHLAALGAPDHLPALICGMAGSRQGWVEARYCDLPASLSGLAALAVAAPGISRDVRIIPGLAQRSAEEPDVMRGEETQLLGAIGGIEGRAVACMPGTHSKWVRIEDGEVRHFRTFMTGSFTPRSATIRSFIMQVRRTRPPPAVKSSPRQCARRWPSHGADRQPLRYPGRRTPRLQRAARCGRSDFRHAHRQRNCRSEIRSAGLARGCTSSQQAPMRNAMARPCAWRASTMCCMTRINAS